MRVRPRRETRGVSRSKCGDLITACIPISWAISIIVNESTDAADLNDGFGTAELVVGVRAYQWGWEYYYPKTIDLNYNVRPSYSSFIGNSVQYNFVSNKSLSSNALWRMYQNKVEDRIITPAHLLLIPLSSGSATNFINFKHIGTNTLKESSAFSKIRNATKINSSHLVSLPSPFSGKYSHINKLFSDENQFLTPSSLSFRKQHNLISLSSLGNSGLSPFLDNISFNKLTLYNLNSGFSLQLNKSQFSQSNLSSFLAQQDSTLPDTSSVYSLLTSFGLRENSNVTKFISYPTLFATINNNSDKPGVIYPILKLTSPNFVKENLNNSDYAFNQSTLTSNSSISQPFSSFSWSNTSTNFKSFSLAGLNSKILLADQSIRAHTDLLPSKANYNLSPRLNTLASNNLLLSQLNITLNPFYQTLPIRTDFPDYSTLNVLASSRSFLSGSYSAVLSSSPLNSNSLSYDTSVSTHYNLATDLGFKIEDYIKYQKNPVSEVFIGSREKTPRAINTAYWSTLWALSNPTNRVSNVLESSLSQSKFYLPMFTPYTDYDFRNDQAIEMLEELFWETNYSAYNFYDYMSITKDISKDLELNRKFFFANKQFFNPNLDINNTNLCLNNSVSKNISLTGQFYGSGAQMEDYPLTPSKTPSKDFILFPTYSDFSDIDDSFNTFSDLKSALTKFSTATVGTSVSSVLPKSYISVFNHFRSDYDDFALYRNKLYSITPFNKNLPLSKWSDGLLTGNDIRSTSSAILRPSIRNAIVNNNAFQKVFRPRLDEGRANVSANSFSDVRLRQPFLSDFKIPYTQLLGKNKTSFFETPLYSFSSQKTFNTAYILADSLNTQMYDFPFLLAKTSDIIRFTWIDWFSKWKHVEVQPSSVSKYSTMGVPYLRKPFDFNSNTGDAFQDTELYFTRVSQSRRNYLSNWAYSPFMYNRSYIWNTMSKFDYIFLDPFDSLSSVKSTLNLMIWYWQFPNTILWENAFLNYSSSGNSVYNKSTWQPSSLIALYYYNVSKLADILSRRELLCRQYLENAHQVVHLPKSLCATPTNPLFQELKSSFLFNDPANFSSEASRDLLFTSAPYFKLLLLKGAVQLTSNSLNTLPLNSSLLTNYLLFYFYTPTFSEIGKNSELFKTQFRPFKKGISSMLRLHATGAVAMPIGIRLQILASSRDVIHSWAIPAASIKIDCVPGYTSHRTMKFLLIGIYWGQCQEICGRYHHWMPIVVKFETPDNFAIWVTHFVSAPTPNETWDISDRRFTNLLRSASYDRSSWLNNLV